MTIKTYSEAQTYLESLIPNVQNKRNTNMRLERIEHLLQLIGNPHHTYKTIHVGGTSGKGSTAYLISHILTTAGYKTGLHISPHLEKINERMQINNSSINNVEFILLTQWIQPYVKEVEKNNLFGAPSYFEVLVAMSFEYFKRKKVDIAVIEVGLGGTLDGTNVINPLIAVITNVSLDHTEILGDTVEKIAKDKSGIIKENTTVITGATQETVIKIIQKKCHEKNTHLLIIDREVNYQIKQSTINGSLFDAYTNKHHYNDIKLSLLGRHQVKNAICAILAIEALKKHHFIVEEKHIRMTFEHAFFAGRMEIVNHNPTIILDGAHNPAKMNALVETMKEVFHKKIIVVVGFKQKKDIDGMISALLPITNHFIITTFSTMTDTGKNLSKNPSEIAKIVKKFSPSLPCTQIPTPAVALEYIFKQSTPDDIILITGSLYLVGEIRSILINKS